MSRNPALEAIFQARYEWENSSDEDRGKLLAAYHRRLDEALTQAGFRGTSRHDIEAALTEPYREFRRAKILEARARLARLR